MNLRSAGVGIVNKNCVGVGIVHKNFVGVVIVTKMTGLGIRKVCWNRNH